MPLAGDQLTIKEALALCSVVGFGTGPELVTAVAVMCAESGRYTGAWHDNLADDGVTVVSTDRGLFQINDKAHPSFSDEDAYDPKLNAVFAADLAHTSSGFNWSPWAAYNSGAYLKFMAEVRDVKALHTWQSRMKLWA